MADLVIKENELKYLDTLIAPIPTQYGLPLVNFFTQVSQNRQQEAKLANEGKREEAPKVNGKKASKEA